MKICTECKFSKVETVDLQNGQLGRVMCCTHEECRDPVNGALLPCNVTRQQAVFCGFKGQYFEQKAPVEATSDSVIQLA